MKVGERGQVTIPKEIRDQFGIRRDTEVEFTVDNGSIVLKKKSKPLDLDKWIGYCGPRMRRLGYRSADDAFVALRGRKIGELPE